MWTSFFVVYNDNVLLAARAAHCYIKYGLQKPMVKVNKLRHAELYILYSMHIKCLFLTVKVVCFDRTILKILDKINTYFTRYLDLWKGGNYENTMS